MGFFRVEAANKRFELNLIFWVIIGPFLLLLTSFFTWSKGGSLGYSLSLVTSLSLPICYLWRVRGLLLSISLLFLSVLISQYLTPDSSTLWSFTLASAFSLGLTVFTLSIEEVLSVVQALQEQGKKRLDQLLALDEQIKKETSTWKLEKENKHTQFLNAQTELKKLETELEGTKKLNLTLRQECEKGHQERLSLLEECNLLKTQPGLSRANQAQEIQRLHDLIKELEDVNLHLNSENKSQQNRIQGIEIDYLEIQKELQVEKQENAKENQKRIAQLNQLRCELFQSELIKKTTQLSSYKSNLTQTIRVLQESLQSKKLECEELQKELANKLDQSEVDSILTESHERVLALEEELKEKIDLKEFEKLQEQAQQEKTDLENQFRKSETFLESELISFKQVAQERFEELQQQLLEKENELEQAKMKIAEANEDAFEKLESQIDTLQLQLKDTQAMNKQLQEENQSFAKKITSFTALLENTQGVQEEAEGDWQKAYTLKERECRQLKGMQVQLRQQFEEKSDVLHHARVEVHRLEGELEEKAREKELQRLENQEDLEMITQFLSQGEDEIQCLQEELRALEELITTFSR
jgi:hypothetical protein